MNYFLIVRFKVNYILNRIVDKIVKYINSRRLINISNLYTFSKEVISDLVEIFKNIDRIENVRREYNTL